MKKIIGGVTAPKGFLASATCANIKYENRPDMALIYSKYPCVSAGVFTKNIVFAAPVKWDKEVVSSGVASQAVVVNAGIANACTGENGYLCCKQMAKNVADSLNLDEKGVLIGSTGVIGKQLPMDKINSGIADLCQNKNNSIESGTDAAKAIMTTDTQIKEIAFSFEINGKAITIGGMAKGSGMIHPNMCTMLSYVTTDAKISKEALTTALQNDVCDTYNMISVDGDTSTNDTVLVLANGCAGNDEIQLNTKEYEIFLAALHEVNEYLAKKIVADGEGATTLFEVNVLGAANKEQASIIAKSVVTSSLTKTAIAGRDANWGRILCAMGYSGATFDPDKVDLYFESAAGLIQIMADGNALDFSEEKATEILSESEIFIKIYLNLGDKTATAWGCDLTHEYVSINADYRS